MHHKRIAPELVAASIALAFGLATLALVSCTKDNQSVLESTTTEVPPGKAITARSADGQFEIYVPAGALDRTVEITIETHRDVEAQGVVGQVYEIRPRRMEFLSAVELRMRIPTAASGASATYYALADVSGGTNRLLSRAVGAGVAEWATSASRIVDGVYYALVTTTIDPCALRACGSICDPCGGNPACSSDPGTCDETGACIAGQPACNTTMPIEGWDDAPGTGRVFVVNDVGVMSMGGFDLDGMCDPAGGCVDNALGQLGDLVNDQLRQGLLGGESLLLFELAGLDAPYNGDDASVAFKIYAARDADDPFYPANNFQVPAGQTTCCEFIVGPQSLAGPTPQARARAPGRVQRGRLTTLSPVPISVTFFGIAGSLRTERALFSARVAADLSELSDGVIGGAFPINTLAQALNPYCRTVGPMCPVQFTDSTMLDLIVGLFQPMPDLDLDGDGLEQLIDTDGDGRIDLCYDGCAGSCTQPDVVLPVDPMRPHTCALSPRIADGYSIAFRFNAVAATITGVSTTPPDASKIGAHGPYEGSVYVNVPSTAFVGWYSHARVRAEPSGVVQIVERGDDAAYHFELTGVAPEETLFIAGTDGPYDPGTIAEASVALPPTPMCPPGGCGSFLLEQCSIIVDFRSGSAGIRADPDVCPLAQHLLIIAESESGAGRDVTNAHGDFSIEVPTSSGSTLTVRAIDRDRRESTALQMIIP